MEKNNPSNFFLTRVSNRTIKVMTDVMRNNIRKESILYSDGHPFYPGIARNLNLRHHVGNHNRGFVSSYGTHTSSIEGSTSVFPQGKKEVVSTIILINITSKPKIQKKTPRRIIIRTKIAST